MSVTWRTLPSGTVTCRAKVFFEHRVIAEKSFQRKTDAKRWDADQLVKLQSGAWIDPTRGRVSFGTLAEEWQNSRQHLAVRSQETTQFLLESYVIPLLGRFPIAVISATDVERVLTAMTVRGLATATRRRVLSVIRLVLDYAVRDRRISVNVARSIPLPKGTPKREPHWLRAERLGKLADAMPPNCRPVVLFLGLAGCRFSEMCALRVDDVVQTPHGLGVRIHRAAPQPKKTSGAIFGPTKTHQTRTVPVPPTLETYVRERIENAPSGSYLFPSPTGAIWTNTNFRVRSRWTETTQSVGLAGTTIHDLRHTAASLLIAAGADVKAVHDDDDGPLRPPVLRGAVGGDGADADVPGPERHRDESDRFVQPNSNDARLHRQPGERSDDRQGRVGTFEQLELAVSCPQLQAVEPPVLRPQRVIGG